MKLNKDFHRKIYLDKRVLVNGNKKLPAYINYENHIELHQWIQDLIDAEEINIPCTCEEVSSTLPQACVKFHLTGGHYEPFSCSSTLIPEDCIKTYKIFSTLEVELFEGNLEDAYTFMIESEDILTNQGFKIVEYITCDNGSTESLDYCFEKYLVQVGPTFVPKIKPSCKCCESVFEVFSDVINWVCEQECLQINFATLFDSNMYEPATVIIDSVINDDEIEYTLIQNIDLPLIYEFCPSTKQGLIVINYHFEDGNANQLGEPATVTINLECL